VGMLKFLVLLTPDIMCVGFKPSKNLCVWGVVATTFRSAGNWAINVVWRLYTKNISFYVLQLKDTEFEKSLNSLELFAYGTFSEYNGEYKSIVYIRFTCWNASTCLTIANPDKFLELSDVQLGKLRILTILSLAANTKVTFLQ